VYIRADRLAAVTIVDEEYLRKVAHKLLTRVLDEFVHHSAGGNCTQCSEGQAAYSEVLQQHLMNYQTPQRADPIARLQYELDETKIVLHNAVSALLERGEKLDQLVARSEKLNAQSKSFYKSVRRANQCCGVYGVLN